MRSSVAIIIIFIAYSFNNASAQIPGNRWIDGGYYDTGGKKVSGLIYWKAPKGKSIFKGEGDKLYFKTTENSERVELLSNQIKSFVIEKDSFVTTQNPKLKKAPFLYVLIHRDTVDLYCSIVYRTIQLGVEDIYGNNQGETAYQVDYYLGPNPEQITEVNYLNFIKMMPPFLADNAEITNKIIDKKYTYSHMKKLLKEYMATTSKN